MHTYRAWLFLMSYPFPLFLFSLGQKNHLSSPRLDSNKQLSAHHNPTEPGFLEGELSTVYRVPIEFPCPVLWRRLSPQTTGSGSLCCPGHHSGDVKQHSPGENHRKASSSGHSQVCLRWWCGGAVSLTEKKPHPSQNFPVLIKSFFSSALLK